MGQKNKPDMFLTGFKRFIQHKDRQTKNSLDPLHQEKRPFASWHAHDLDSIAFYSISANILSLLSPVKVFDITVRQTDRQQFQWDSDFLFIYSSQKQLFLGSNMLPLWSKKGHGDSRCEWTSWGDLQTHNLTADKRSSFEPSD